MPDRHRVGDAARRISTRNAALHARITPRIELATTLLSSAILIAFALRIASDALGAR